MKRLSILLIILSILIASPLYAQVCRGHVGVIGLAGTGSGGGSTSHCASSTTCTAATPGSCELLCEDFEGSTSCYSGYTANCRSTADNIVVASSDTVSFQSTPSIGSCSDEGTNALSLTVTGGSHSTSSRWYLGSDQTKLYGEFYININSMTLGTSSIQTIFFVTDGSGNMAFHIGVYNNGGTWMLQMQSAGMTTRSGTTTLSPNTWYRVGFLADQTGGVDTLTVYLNGSQELQSTDFTTSIAMRRLCFGATLSANYAATAYVTQYDNIAFSATGIPGGCNP